MYYVGLKITRSPDTTLFWPDKDALLQPCPCLGSVSVFPFTHISDLCPMSAVKSLGPSFGRLLSLFYINIYGADDTGTTNLM